MILTSHGQSRRATLVLLSNYNLGNRTQAITSWGIPEHSLIISSLKVHRLKVNLHLFVSSNFQVLLIPFIWVYNGQSSKFPCLATTKEAYFIWFYYNNQCIQWAPSSGGCSQPIFYYFAFCRLFGALCKKNHIDRNESAPNFQFRKLLRQWGSSTYIFGCDDQWGVGKKPF